MRSMVEGRREAPFLTIGSLRSRPSTAFHAVPLPSKARGGSGNQAAVQPPSIV